MLNDPCFPPVTDFVRAGPCMGTRDKDRLSWLAFAIQLMALDGSLWSLCAEQRSDVRLARSVVEVERTFTVTPTIMQVSLLYGGMKFPEYLRSQVFQGVFAGICSKISAWATSYIEEAESSSSINPGLFGSLVSLWNKTTASCSAMNMVMAAIVLRHVLMVCLVPNCRLKVQLTHGFSQSDDGMSDTAFDDLPEKLTEAAKGAGVKLLVSDMLLF